MFTHAMQLFRPEGSRYPTEFSPFEPLFGPSFFGPLEDLGAEVSETDDEVSISLELPGFDKEKIEVACERRTLSISAERVRKSGTAKFERRYVLPDYIDPKTVEAEYRDGILVVTAKRLPESKPRKIAVK